MNRAYGATAPLNSSAVDTTSQNQTVSKIKTVLKLFCFSSISLYGRQKRQHNPNSHMSFHYPLSVLPFIHSLPSHSTLSSSAYRAFAFHCYLLLQLSILFSIICQTTISTENRRPFACSKQPCLSRRYQISIRM